MTPDVTPNVLCIGSVLWDIIGRSTSHMRAGSDVPGRITRIPGGVALNIAMALKAYGMQPALLSTVGQDAAGHELVAECTRMGMITAHLYRSEDLPTDAYMAVEGGNGLIAAIADAHSLEQAGEKVLRPLLEGELRGWAGIVALDGNLTEALLSQIARHPAFDDVDLRIAPASPGKAERLTPFLSHGRATLYVNLEEANLLLRETHDTAIAAARALVGRGVFRAMVTNGGEAAACADAAHAIKARPRAVMVTRVTGAGDTFMAAHIAAEAKGVTPEAALERALEAAAIYVSGETY